jgi:hypothetical protein
MVHLGAELPGSGGDSMYSSLQKPADIMAKLKDGRSIYVLSDHRSFAEIESDLDLSVAFALVRTINAGRFARASGGHYLVVYSTRERPPDRMVQAIVSAGGVLEVNHVEQPFIGSPMDTTALIDEALRGMGQADAARTGKPLTLEGLKALQAEYASWTPKLEDDEIAYWSSVMHLGAFAGEVLRGAKGGGWAVTEEFDRLDIPIIYVYETAELSAELFLLSKVMKFLENPQEDSVEACISEGISVADHMPPPSTAK